MAETKPTAAPATPSPATPAPATPSPATTATATPADGRVRAIIDAVLPAVDAGRFPIKRLAGDCVRIEAHCFADGHDALRVALRWQADSGEEVHEVEMAALGNDVWVAEFTPPLPGRYRYTVMAWVDAFETWRVQLAHREAPDDICIALAIGAALIEAAAGRADGADAATLGEWAAQLRRTAAEAPAAGTAAAQLKAAALDPSRTGLAARYADRGHAATCIRELVADRARAGFGSWYEMFPRSAAAEPGRHGSFRDVEARLPYVAQMGFDVLYFPPIHPIGRNNRKGANNALHASAADVGSPWAIGAAEGGHKDILAQLGTFEDFRRLLEQAAHLGLEIALDIAFQVAPDHPYVLAHPQWFKHRPDGSVQFAENPPKKYQDIYPFDFESDDWRSLWQELRSIVDFWIAQGVRIFRVDNPHTKTFAFWEWLIGGVKRAYPEVIFLAEAFTRPKVMHRLAKLGFSQSYTYFTWRNTKAELTEYFTELAHGPGSEYLRPNVWPNTPDILHETLQSGARAAFAARLVLAGTLAANFGLYGPAYELMESAPREPGGEEYRDSEKYQLRHWPIDRPDSLQSLIARVNRIRRENPALQSDRSLRFLAIDNPQLIAYLKIDPPSGNVVVVAVNLDPRNVQSGWLELDLNAAEFDLAQPYQAHDLLSGQRYRWEGRRNYVSLDPSHMPAHVLTLRRLVRSERDFDYFS